ncbi:MAG: nucleotidyltransferase family protein [Phenylobacterium sp.]|uniref:nucleotidyltransferase family protein n=1 Tax=Phenylobacterium sp. TaxID=1871053 RepID=UPI0025CC2EED|nr:nucleotidyltransferase family protein [Phenylobacterium sp.]MCG9915399.1 nucleotidyltransferase family protein [Phenylobacterium sp.]
MTPEDAILERRLEAILRDAPSLMGVMEIARDLALPDWMIFSGAIYQKAVNHLTGRDPDYGLKDYDLGYFDAGDLSYDAEDAVIRRAAASYPPPLDTLVEVRNQARVHLWFEDRFGEPYAPLASSAEALRRFTTTMFAVGARLEPDGRLRIFAPFGLADLFALRLVPNPLRQTQGFARTAAAALDRWPELTLAD